MNGAAMTGYRPATARDDKGFVLIVVLWGVALLITIAAVFTRATATHTKITANLIVNAELEAAADAGVHLAIMRLLETRSRAQNGGSATTEDRTAYHCRFTESIVLEIATEDEGGKVDLNAAPGPLLRALFEGFGAPADKARALADAVLDFRDADDTARPFGAEAKSYQAADLSWTASNGRFLAIEELEQVYGMTQRLFKAVRPHVTVHSKRSGIDPEVASPSLLEALSSAHAGRPNPAAGNSDARRLPANLPEAFLAASAKRSFRARVVAHHASGGIFVRAAIIEATPNAPLPFAVHAWHRGERDSELEGETAVAESIFWRRLNSSTPGDC